MDTHSYKHNGLETQAVPPVNRFLLRLVFSLSFFPPTHLVYLSWTKRRKEMCVGSPHLSALLSGRLEEEDHRVGKVVRTRPRLQELTLKPGRTHRTGGLTPIPR